MRGRNENRIISILITVVVHASAVILLSFIALRTPLPLPGEAGVEVDLGMYNQGVGRTQPQKPAKVVTPAQKVSKAEPVKEKVVTQDTEEAPSIEEPKKIKTKKEEPVEKTPPIEEPKPVVNQRALFKSNNSSDVQPSSEGITGEHGDQGNPDGLSNIDRYESQGGSGGGPSYSLGGRGAKHLPSPEKEFSEEGTVVVNITVDVNGKVLKAEIGKGTTITNATQRETARQAALKAIFTEDKNAPEQQKGTITYKFIIRQ